MVPSVNPQLADQYLVVTGGDWALESAMATGAFSRPLTTTTLIARSGGAA